jgi:hypothetical protein
MTRTNDTKSTSVLDRATHRLDDSGKPQAKEVSHLIGAAQVIDAVAHSNQPLGNSRREDPRVPKRWELGELSIAGERSLGQTLEVALQFARREPNGRKLHASDEMGEWRVFDADCSANGRMIAKSQLSRCHTGKGVNDRASLAGTELVNDFTG